MMRNKFATIAVSMIAVAVLIGCNPMQRAAWESRHGYVVPAELTVYDDQLPDEPWRDGSVWINPDGSTTLVTQPYHYPVPEVDRWFVESLDAGWSPEEWVTLSCVIAGESLGRPELVNDRGELSVGLIQINLYAHLNDVVYVSGIDPSLSYSERVVLAVEWLKVPHNNFRYGRRLFDSVGKRWHPWTAARAC